jgi:low affinity Fe/Cu permease
VFGRFAAAVADHAGRATTFAGALAIILLWAITGPFFGWSDTWQLIINTGTTIVTFLIVFLLQHTQNKDTAAINLKLDEILRCMPTRESDQYVAIDRRPEREIQAARRQIAERTGDV